ncbi:hypothetical protein SAVCW2_63100 [Streptomyces avermitilis]|nr:hypothetical protein SAVCW2_63100 [Streptomyces avermitilis]
MRSGFQVEPVARLGEAQIGVDTGDDHTDVDLENFDSDEGDPHEGVDDEPSVEYELQNVIQPTGATSATGLLCGDNGHAG